MKRTVSIPVNLPHERFLPLMGFCADIFNQHVDWALKERTWNKNKVLKASILNKWIAVKVEQDKPALGYAYAEWVENVKKKFDKQLV